mgnify:CR=1 FL=1
MANQGIAMQVLAILQARFNSTRLPGKVLKPILGKAMLAQQVERLQQVKSVDKLIIATSSQASDDVIEQLCQKLAVNCYRGSLDDVLDRYYQASKNHQAQHIVRITGDCPLIDIDIVEQVVNMHTTSNFDYTSNIQPATFPDGLDVEIFKFSALEKAWLGANKPSEREHVTLYIRNNPDLYNCQNFTHTKDLSHLRWTVDEPEDFDFVTKVYQALYQKKPFFNYSDIISLLIEQPHLQTINQKYIRNEGLLKSQAQDKELGYE